MHRSFLRFYSHLAFSSSIFLNATSRNLHRKYVDGNIVTVEFCLLVFAESTWVFFRKNVHLELVMLEWCVCMGAFPRLWIHPVQDKTVTDNEWMNEIYASTANCPPIMIRHLSITLSLLLRLSLCLLSKYVNQTEMSLLGY